MGTADATLILGLLTINFADVKDAEPINDKESYSFVTGTIVIGITDGCC